MDVLRRPARSRSAVRLLVLMIATHSQSQRYYSSCSKTRTDERFRGLPGFVLLRRLAPPTPGARPPGPSVVNSTLFPAGILTVSRAQESRRPLPPSGSAFIRLLAALDDVATFRYRSKAFAQRLSRWVEWTDAIPLSEALASPSTRTQDAGSAASMLVNADEREFRRVRAALAKLAQPPAAASADRATSRRTASPARASPPMRRTASRRTDERYLAAQRAMEANIVEPLRRRLRSTLAGASPAQATRLAALDAVMEQVVGARERELLATVPRRLERRFEQLRQDHLAAQADAPAPDTRGTRPEPDPWLATFHQDMRALLLAELDLRMQPVEGLLEALRRSRRLTRHEQTSSPTPSSSTGLAALGWVGVGYVGANPLALTVTALIAAFYLMGVLDLHRFRQATSSLAQAVAEMPDPLPDLRAWLARVHPSLQNAVRRRVEGEPVGLPGPAMAPYLAGLLVLLGMLGTFLGMVLTLRGTGIALENATDLQAVRGSLVAPVKGLGLAFGTSVAGVADVGGAGPAVGAVRGASACRRRSRSMRASRRRCASSRSPTSARSR